MTHGTTRWLVVWLAFGFLSSTAADQATFFQSAKPVWPAGREAEMNLLVGFRAVVAAPAPPNAVLRVAASTLYRARVNGEFLGHGPARGPHDYYRVDEWDLSGKLAAGQNVVAIEVAGYNCNSYYLLDQPSFLQAEIVADGEVLASTAGEGVPFTAAVLEHRVQKIQRYSFQRPFIEVYRLQPDTDGWLREPAATWPTVDCQVQPAKKPLPRHVLAPEFAVIPPVRHVASGRTERLEIVANLWKDRSLVNVGPQLKGYPESELAMVPSTELQHLTSAQTAAVDQPYRSEDHLELSENKYHILDLGANLTGFLGARIRCSTKTRLAFTFDEILSGPDVDFKRLGCVNAVSYELEPGEYQVESLEPYTLRYWKLLCRQGACTLRGLYLRECAHPAIQQAQFACSDQRLDRLFAAGVLTFRQNALDVFMDCPSRERAGWLCDSYFTARSAHDLTGTTLIERNFFENFLLPERFAHLPDGMLPMCYPADHNDGVFIPNWALWFVVQLEEYAARSGERTIVDGLRAKVLRLMEFFQQYENADGLLEKLPSWVFVEWSKANEFVQDVNYPSNMLYAAALSAAGRIYGIPELTAKAERIRETIRRQSFDGQFFVDNAVRRDGKLQVTRNHSEVCQYFAFFFECATPQSHTELWDILCRQFGPDRAQTKAFPEVHVANSFVGNMLRMELLSRGGLNQQILDESIAYLLYMAERTGTLWENVGDYASCNHGFASHVVHTLYRDVLGVSRVDQHARKIFVRFGDLKLDWCEGRLPLSAGEIRLRWWKDGDQLLYTLGVPPGYEVQIENLSGKTLLAK
jgi:alpha-L-rhamnosidase